MKRVDPGAVRMKTATSGGRSRLAGIALVLASTVPFALAGTLTRLIPASLWQVIGWRGVVGGGCILAFAWLAGERQPMGWRGWVVALVGAAASVAFLAAFRMTQVANVTLIYALAPFAAALIERLALGVPVARGTLVGAAVSAFGVAVMVAGGLGAERAEGDLAALAMMALFALYTVLIRAWPATPSLKAGGWSAIVLFPVAAVLDRPFAVAPGAWAGIFGFGISFALAVMLYTMGARRISAAETGFYGGFEIPFSIVFAWAILHERPAAATGLGGAIVLVSVGAGAVQALRRG
ncbi:MAG: DMT family transporter [Defluviimonas sp.]|uniref:DMT family transporter n=1 Tax=Albidovulum sp. TaxID=1872424 RepID=UPI001D8A002F|nr:DMT family transporter [Paracoccaceae bacterium]MCC0063696.1 DMT family transporter [Defluviimonas sp.]